MCTITMYMVVLWFSPSICHHSHSIRPQDDPMIMGSMGTIQMFYFALGRQASPLGDNSVWTGRLQHPVLTSVMLWSWSVWISGGQ